MVQNSLGVKTKNLKVENFSNCCIFVRIFSFDLNTIICFPCTIFDILTQNKFMPTFDKYFFLTTNFTIYFSGLIYRYFLCGVLEYVYSTHTSLEIYETYVFSHHCGGLKFFFSSAHFGRTLEPTLSVSDVMIMTLLIWVICPNIFVLICLNIFVKNCANIFGQKLCKYFWTKIVQIFLDKNCANIFG